MKSGILASFMGMRETTWERHANPWSVWTRIPLLPAFAAVLYWRDSFGVWLWPLLAALVLWAFANPRAFPPPKSTDNWASKAVMGERVWLNRRSVPIPRHHERWALGLTLVSLGFLLPLAWGVVVLDFWMTAFGVVGVAFSKLWLVDRMVWLYEDMRVRVPEYGSWLREAVAAAADERKGSRQQGKH